MFAAPIFTTTGLFTTIPDHFKISDDPMGMAARMSHQVHSFLEGPGFDKDGNLYCVDIPFGRIFRIDPQGHWDLVVQYDGRPNGLRIHPDGTLYVADRKNGIVVIDPASGDVRNLFSDVRETFRGPNDLMFAANGDLYFTDQGASDIRSPHGRVMRRRAATGELEIVLDGLAGPNGLAISPDGRSLAVALTRTNQILRAALLPDGSVDRLQNWIQLSGGHGPDGILYDSEGGMVICHPGLGCVWRFSPRGEPVFRVNLSIGDFGTNIAFGGADNRQLYITESITGTIQTAEMPVAGMTPFSHL